MGPAPESGGYSPGIVVKVFGAKFNITLEDSEDKQSEGKGVAVSGTFGTSGDKKPSDQKPSGGTSGGTKTDPATKGTKADPPPKPKGQRENPMDDRPVRGGPSQLRNPVATALARGGPRRPTSEPGGWMGNNVGTSGAGGGARVDWDLVVGGGVTDPVPYGDDVSRSGPQRKGRRGNVRQPKKPTSEPDGGFNG